MIENKTIILDDNSEYTSFVYRLAVNTWINESKDMDASLMISVVPTKTDTLELNNDIHMGFSIGKISTDPRLYPLFQQLTSIVKEIITEKETDILQTAMTNEMVSSIKIKDK